MKVSSNAPNQVTIDGENQDIYILFENENGFEVDAEGLDELMIQNCDIYKDIPAEARHDFVAELNDLHKEYVSLPPLTP